MRTTWYLTAAFTLLSFSVAALNSVGLDVEMSGFRNNEGKARVCLFDSEKGFPLKTEEAFQVVLTDISEGRARVTFRAVPPGIYAVSVLHDENDNGKMDTNVLGRPREGVGASNNPKSFLGPPSFDEARFAVDGANMIVRLIIRYP